jgi:hypothetical protein
VVSSGNGVRNRFLFLMAILAAGTAYRPRAAEAPKSGAPARSSQQSKPNGGAGTDTPHPKIEEPLHKLHEFFTTDPHDMERCPLKKPPCRFCRLPVEFLLATVPDPENSHFPLMFDRSVESIQLAAQDCDYTYDRHWLPWSRESEKEEGDWRKREEFRAWKKRRQEQPGIVLFRYFGKEKKDHLLAVLLIGENPASGINKVQFENAVRLVRHVKQNDDGKPIRVLGPTYSGSITSLGMAIAGLEKHKDIQCRACRFSVITGSATAPSNRENLAKISKGRACYQAVVQDDDRVRRRFLEYLDKQDVSLCEVAILSEVGTEYGSQPLRRRDGSQGHCKGRAEVLQLRYPLEISRLRNAYQDDPELSVLWSQRPGQAPRQSLELKLGDARESEDRIPTFSPGQTPLSQESVLEGITSTIRREHIRFVGIAASDPLDELFLGRLIRKKCPDVRLFLFDADVLFAHPAENSAFVGTLMVSTYPLFTRNQVWTDSWVGNLRSQFATTWAEGVYNACRAHLGRTNWVPSAPLWITVVGRDGLWPLAQPGNAELDASSSLLDWLLPAPQVADGRTRMLEELSHAWELTCVLLIIFCFGYVWAYCYHNLPCPKKKKRKWFSSLRLGPKDDDLFKRVYLFVATFWALAACASIAGIHYWYHTLNNEPVDYHVVFLLIALLAMLGLLVTLVLKVRSVWAITSLLLALVGIGYLLIAFASLKPFSVSNLILIYRSIHPANGVSPVIPSLFLLAGLYLWGWVHVQRLELENMRLAELPKRSGDALSPLTLDDAVDDAVGKTFFRALDWIVSGGVLVLGFLLFCATDLRSLEGRVFDKLYAAALFGLYAAILLAFSRFLCVWFVIQSANRSTGWRKCLHGRMSGGWAGPSQVSRC